MHCNFVASISCKIHSTQAFTDLFIIYRFRFHFEADFIIRSARCQHKTCFVKKKKRMAKKLSNHDRQLLKNEYLAWSSENTQKQFSILVTGKTGVGKSRLVNALVGRKVAQEGRLRSACTDTVTSYRVEIDGVEVVVWDSPGLQDGTCNERLYLADMKGKLDAGFDVMIYCLSMTETRFYEADKKAIRAMTECFGKDLWRKAVVALNFANRITDPDEEDELAYFMGEKYFWDKAIDDILNDLGIDCNVRDVLPIVPTGTYKKLRLPTCENWLSELWMGCYTVMSVSSGLTLYRISENRLTFTNSPSSAAVASINRSCGDDDQPLIPESDTEQGQDDSGDIPREIPLNEEQEERFLRKIWAAFVRGCRKVKDLVKDLGHAVIRSFTRDA